MRENYWKKALIQSKKAIELKSLTPLETKTEIYLTNNNEKFEIRVLSQRFESFSKIYGPKINPFIPWDKNLEINQIEKKHVLILNKYPVQLGHMLLITKEWSPQNGWLDLDDFKSILKVSEDTSGLWFFNSGPNAGASQPHRHFQLLRRKEEEKVCPRNLWFKRLANNDLLEDSLLSQSSAAVLRRNNQTSTNNKSIELYNDYLYLCHKLQLGSPEKNIKPTCDYNLLITSEWVSIIRRSGDTAFGFNINSLGFAGYLITDNQDSLNWLKFNGVYKLLDSVVFPIKDKN